MTLLLLKYCHTDQRTGFLFFCGLKDIMQMLFTVKCLQCMVTNGPMKKVLGGQKFASDTEVQ